MIKESFHADTDALPWAEGWAGDPGIRLKLLMADVEGQRFAVRMQFAPGLAVAPHKHTGEVHAFRWRANGITSNTRTALPTSPAPTCSSRRERRTRCRSRPTTRGRLTCCS